jgi:hypothetical protein
MRCFSLHNRFGWLISLPILAVIVPDAHAQSRSARGGSVMTPSMTMIQMPTTNTTTNALLQRNLRLDARILRELRFDRYSMQNYGRMTYMGIGGYGAYGGYAGYSGLGGYGSGLGGYASTNAAAPASTSLVDPAKAALLNEQVVAERIANRRRAFDEQLYERERTPTSEQALLDRSRSAPRVAEVHSGQALNALLADLQKLGAGTDSSERADILLPLDEHAFQRINLTHGVGNIALLKNGGQFRWPGAPTGTAFQEARDRLETLAPKAIEQVRTSGRVNSHTMSQMVAAIDLMHKTLRQGAGDLSFQPFTEARAFLQSFDDAIVALQQPDAADHLNGAYRPRPQTVFGLVKRMTDNGLRFAPAISGDEAAYSSLCNALRACDLAAISQSVSR